MNVFNVKGFCSDILKIGIHTSMGQMASPRPHPGISVQSEDSSNSRV